MAMDEILDVEDLRSIPRHVRAVFERHAARGIRCPLPLDREPQRPARPLRQPLQIDEHDAVRGEDRRERIADAPEVDRGFGRRLHGLLHAESYPSTNPVLCGATRAPPPSPCAKKKEPIPELGTRLADPPSCRPTP